MKRSCHLTIITHVCLAGLCLLFATACSRPKPAAPPLTAETTEPPPAPEVQLGEAPRLPEDKN